MRFFRFIFSFCLLLTSLPALALNLDGFDGVQTLIPVGTGAVQSSAISQASSLGGTRAMRAQVLSGTYLALLTDAGILNHSQGASVTGISLITWDGDLDPDNLNYTGLGGIDLTEDSSTAFKLKIVSFDFPFDKTASLTLTVYDASDPSGQKASSSTYLLSSQMSDTIVELPFSAFAISGRDGPADFTSVGAITLLINGSNPAVDLQLDFLSTNGNCALVPNPGGVIDECGVCGGDNSTCKDCEGIPNGTKLPGTACNTSFFGPCGLGSLNQACQCAPQYTPQSEICDSIDNDCDGQTDDEVDCFGCQVADQTSTLAKLDAGAKDQERVIIRVSKILRRIKRDQATTNYVISTLDRAHTLQIRNWVLSWTLPRVSKVCNNEVLCTSDSTEPILDEYRTHALQLRNLAFQFLNKIKRARGYLLPGEKKNQLLAQRMYDKNMALAATIPIRQSSCL